MSQSREALAMDFTSRSQSSITFGRTKGCYVSRCLAVTLVILFIASLILTGLLVFYLGKCDYLLQKTPTDNVVSDATQAPPTAAKITDVRLPSSIVPDLYKIKLIPFLDGNFSVHGDVWITLNVTLPSKNVTLHKKNMTITKENVVLKDIKSGRIINISDQKEDTDRDFYIVLLEEELKPGQQYELYLPFQAILNEKLFGFYRSSYKMNNETRWMAVTQFQPTDARRAFPCFDEPGLKARFQITIARSPQHSSVSNMPIKNTVDAIELTDLPGWKWDEFETSLRMSTYLVAFLVSDMTFIKSDASLSNVEFRIWARKEAISQAQYASNIGPRILEFFEDYFNISFPLPKQDMAALPDFSAGAMENWGLITYRETALLFDDKISSALNKQRVATVVSHELAHQWFGNLVTPKWWDDLWLNEGFASYVEYLGVNEVEKNWKIMEQFVEDEVQNVFSLDALESSHPISVPVGNPDEINEIFDRISYGKGASLLRMMDHFLTTKTFRQGLHNYLQKWKFRNTEQTDLWESLTEQAHKDKTLMSDVTVKEIMDTWTLQKGFPTVTIKRDYNKGIITAEQKQFILLSKHNISNGPQWWIPLSYTYSNFSEGFTETAPKHWISKDQTSLEIKDLTLDKDKWIIFNVQETGYYRVNYDTENWKLIFTQLRSNHNAVGTINRAQIIDDSLNLARAGLLDYETALDATKYLQNEMEYLPWSSAFSNFGYLKDMLIRSEAFGEFRRYILTLVRKLFYEVGFEKQPGDEQLEIFRRTGVIGWACSMGLQDCISNATTLYQTWMDKSNPDSDNPIPVDLKRTVYCTAIREGGEKEWNFAWKRYLSANVGSEKDNLLSSMGCSKEVWILSRYLSYSTSKESGIKLQDGHTVLRTVAANSIGHFLTFNFLRDQWSSILEYYGNAKAGRSAIVVLSHSFNTRFELQQLLNFKNANINMLGAAKRSLDQAIEKTEANIRWMDQNYKKINDWLKKTNSEFQ